MQDINFNTYLGDKHAVRAWKFTQQLQVLCNYLVGRLERRLPEVSNSSYSVAEFPQHTKSNIYHACKKCLMIMVNNLSCYYQLLLDSIFVYSKNHLSF